MMNYDDGNVEASRMMKRVRYLTYIGQTKGITVGILNLWGRIMNIRDCVHYSLPITKKLM